MHCHHLETSVKQFNCSATNSFFGTSFLNILQHPAPIKIIANSTSLVSKRCKSYQLTLSKLDATIHLSLRSSTGGPDSDIHRIYVTSQENLPFWSAILQWNQEILSQHGFHKQITISDFQVPYFQSFFAKLQKMVIRGLLLTKRFTIVC